VIGPGTVAVYHSVGVGCPIVDAVPRVEVTPNGPYVVTGVPLVRTAQVETEFGEPVAWEPDEPIAQEPSMRVCRCGDTATQPFCDDACATNGFDGAEEAPRDTYAERRYPYQGEGFVLEDDLSLCTQAGYCGDRFENVWAMILRSADPEVRERIRTMSALCPSGRIRTIVEGGEPDEIDHEPSAAAIVDGPLWVRGGVPVVAADGVTYEVRHRQTLCRCGRSGNKPFCDGTHKQVDFRDG
jgi:CDGSH-type Zn-finger protein